MFFFVQDGHYWFQTKAVDELQPMENTPSSNMHFKPPSRLRFSKEPIIQYSTHSVEVGTVVYLRGTSVNHFLVNKVDFEFRAVPNCM